MEKAASSYAKFNRVDLEDEQAVPYEMIVVQPFTATDDPTVLGIKPIPNLQEKIDQMIKHYGAETIDIEDIDYEEADLEEEMWNPKTEEQPHDLTCLFQHPAAVDAAHRCQYYRYCCRATYRQNGLYRLSLRATQHATHAGKHGWYRRTHVQAWSDQHHSGPPRRVASMGLAA